MTWHDGDDDFADDDEDDDIFLWIYTGASASQKGLGEGRQSSLPSL